MNIVAIIQARMASTRLPGKVMFPLLGLPVIAHVVARVRRIPRVTRVLVATSLSASDDPLAAYVAEQTAADVFRGAEADVLARYDAAAQASHADVVVRVTADCPLLSPTESGRVLMAYLERAGAVDYVCNALPRTYPRGLDTEVFTRHVLQRAAAEASAPADREHVTSYIWRNPHLFPQHNVVAARDHHHYRWTLDTWEDYALLTRIYEALYPRNNHFEYAETIALLEEHPDWHEINSQITQKTLTF